MSMGKKLAQLGLPDEGCAIKGLVICNNWDLEPLDLLNGLALLLGCYQTSPVVLIVLDNKNTRLKYKTNKEIPQFFYSIILL